MQHNNAILKAPLKEILSTLTQRGQVTIPAEVRRFLGVKPSDKITFAIEKGQVKLLPARFTLESVYGSVRPNKKPENFERLIQQAKKEHAKKTIKKFKRV